MEQEEITKPEGRGGNFLKTALKVLLGALVVLAIIVGGIRLVQKVAVKQSSEKKEQTGTNTGGGFPTPAVSSPTIQTPDGPKVFGQSQAGQLPASGPPLLSLIMLAGAGLAGVYLTKRS